MTPDTSPIRAVQPIPIYRFTPSEAEKAFEAFAALRRIAQSNPALVENEYFTALQDTAYARFHFMFEALQ